MAADLLDQLPPDGRAGVVAAADRLVAEAEEVVWLEGGAPSGMLIVETGLLRIERVTPTGQRQVLTLAGPGDTVGELSVLDRSDRSATVIAMQPSTMLRLSQRDFDELVALHPELAIAIARTLADRLRALTDQLVEIAGGTALVRTASRIAQLVPPTVVNGTYEVDTRISQAELAAWAGLSREGIVKALRELRLNGVIETSRQRIRVLDVELLRGHARR